jgi:two-component system, OmpR family, sensor histidine kinase KdpD
MLSPVSPDISRSLVPVIRGCVVLGLIAALAFALHLNSAAAGSLFLMAVVLNCLDSGVLAAVVVSGIAVGLLNYFFVEPLFSFRVADPVDVTALAAFLTASLVTTLLASRAREQARAARRDRYCLELLYECAQKLLILDPLRTEPTQFLEVIRRVFGLKAASYFDATSAALFVAGDAGGGLAEKTRDAYILKRNSTDPASQTSLRQLSVAGRDVGAIGFEGMDQAEIIASPTAALVAIGLERAQACKSATRAEDAARTETLRTAVLDALAHESKTPLATILTATGALREAGPLNPHQSKMADVIEMQGERLGHLSSRLLRLASLESSEVRLQLESFRLEEEVKDAVDRYAAESPRRSITIVNRDAPEEVVADVELFHLALGQLVDNACKYSPPGSTIEVSLESDGHVFSVVVASPGAAILPSERSLIFERFFRGSEGRRLAGSGLGLNVARKIAVAHGGSLDLAPPQSVPEGVAFRLTFPIRGGSRDGIA